MQLAAKVTSRLIHAQEEEAATPEARQPMSDTEKTTVVEHRWKRMATQIHLVNQHASSGAIIHHMEKMRDRIEEDARKAYERAAGSNFQQKAKAQNSKKPRNPDLSKADIVGNPLSRSDAKRWIYDPEMCTHDEKSIHGNGKALWFTCTRCGSRWERLSVEQWAARCAKTSPGAATAIPPAAPPGPGQEPTTAAAVMTPLERAIGEGLIRGHNMLITPEAARRMGMNVARNMSDTADTSSTTAPSEASSRDTKRKTEDFQMVGLTPMGQAAFEQFQEIYKEDAET